MSLMQKNTAYILVLAMIIACAMLSIPIAFAQDTVITANVTVSCIFSLSLNTLAVYPKGSDISANYSIKTLSDCNIASMPGNFILYKSNNVTPVFTEQLTVSAAPALKRYNISIPTNSLALGRYTAVLSFNDTITSNTSTSTFYLLAPPNVILKNFSASSRSLSQGAPISLYLLLNNSGAYAASNIIAHISISGPKNYTLNSTPSSLAAFPANETLTLQETNITTVPGTYSATAYATYEVAGSFNELKTNALNLTYNVIARPTTAPSPPHIVVPITKIPFVLLSSAPVYVEATSNSSVVADFSIGNSGNYTENITLSVPEYFESFAKLSTSSIIIKPATNITVGVLLDSDNLTPGTYVIPVNITGMIDNKFAYATEYVTYTVSSEVKGKPLMQTQVDILNNTNTGYVVIGLSTPQNVSLSNITLVTQIPMGIVPNSSRVSAYGIPNNITEGDGYYNIAWHVAYIGPDQTIYAYVKLNRPKNQDLFTAIKSSIFTPSTTSTSIFRMLDMEVPTFYADSNGTIKIEALYTGTSAQQVDFTLLGQPSTIIYNASQRVNASPNQVIDISFPQRVSNSTGTLIEELYVNTPGANLTYSIPVLVLARPIATTTIVTTTTIAPVKQVTTGITYEAVMKAIDRYSDLIILFIIAVIAGAAIGALRKRPRYSSKRAKRLSQIKEQITRGE